MRMIDLIEKKKAGGAHTAEELRFLTAGITNGSIPDGQLAAWAMAVCFRGMTRTETAALTQEMAKSGEQVDLSTLGGCTVDKHSTGGVGDKTTLIVAPLVAACGGIVAKMSGRGLGHTGGTADKLEAIPGYRTELAPADFLEQVRKIGVAVVSQSGNLAPADKRLYALRDVTGTVDSVPLIAASVMSKKLAAGARSIVLDVKFGSGAFMKTREEAQVLAEEMVEIGRAVGRRVSALLTDMDQPLGCAVGNALEVEEAAAVLQGEGPDDLKELSLVLAAEMLSLCHGCSREEARKKAGHALHSGAAFAKMQEWVRMQGGDPAALTESGHMPRANLTRELCAPRAGFIRRMDAGKIGQAVGLLGAGRSVPGEKIDLGAGLILFKKTGAQVEKGEPIARLYASREDLLRAAGERALQAFVLDSTPPETRPLIARRIGGTV